MDWINDQVLFPVSCQISWLSNIWQNIWQEMKKIRWLTFRQPISPIGITVYPKIKIFEKYSIYIKTILGQMAWCRLVRKELRFHTSIMLDFLNILVIFKKKLLPILYHQKNFNIFLFFNRPEKNWWMREWIGGKCLYC